MKILLINNGTKYIDQLENLLRDYEINTVDYKGSPLNPDKSYDLIILSGGGHQNNAPVVWDKDYYQNEVKLIKETEKPLIGVCLGFELLAFTYRAKLIKRDYRERGIVLLEALVDSPIFNGKKSFGVFENHFWVVKELPEVLVGLAKSSDGIEIIKHKNKNQFGFQFHPEVLEEGTQGAEIFLNTIRLLSVD